MLMKLKEAELYYESVSEKLSQPGIAADQAEFRRLMQEYKRLTPIVLKYREYLEAEKRISEAEKILSSAKRRRLWPTCLGRVERDQSETGTLVFRAYDSFDSS